MRKLGSFLLVLLIGTTVVMAQDNQRWSEEKANNWYKSAALAGWIKLHSGRCYQPTGDVAGRQHQPDRDRQGAGLGARTGHEHDASLSP